MRWLSPYPGWPILIAYFATLPFRWLRDKWRKLFHQPQKK